MSQRRTERTLRAGLLAVLLTGLPSCSGGTSEGVSPGGLGADCLAAGDAGCTPGFCLTLDTHTAYCSQECQGPTDCPTGFICLAYGTRGKVCQALGAGGVCSSDNDCPAGLKCDVGSARCYVPVTRSACGACTSDLQCGAGGTCHAEASGETFCAPVCDSGSCPTGFLCAPAADAGNAMRCLPLQAGSSPPAAGSCRGGRPLCAPCSGDLECGKPGDLCARNLISEESFCATKCTKNTDCPNNFSCTDLSGKGTGPFQCLPNSGTCAGYCDIASTTGTADIARECGRGSTCDYANRKCARLTDGSLCAACESDLDCSTHVGTARCVQNVTAGSPFQGQKFCGSDCSLGTCPGVGCTANPSACTPGFACAAIGAGGGLAVPMRAGEGLVRRRAAGAGRLLREERRGRLHQRHLRPDRPGEPLQRGLHRRLAVRRRALALLQRQLHPRRLLLLLV
jgi:hypothetical protein